MNKPLMFGIVLISLYSLSQPSHADESQFDIGPKFRAKIAKEKAKQASVQSLSGKNTSKFGDNGEGDCGSQNIGNVNTNGRIGTAPREVFVFAPNAINLVGRGGCQ